MNRCLPGDSDPVLLMDSGITQGWQEQEEQMTQTGSAIFMN